MSLNPAQAFLLLLSLSSPKALALKPLGGVASREITGYKFGIREGIKRPVTLLDVAGVLGRFREREEFFDGRGYSRKSISDGQLLTSARFYERVKGKPFLEDAWPVDLRTGQKLGIEEGQDETSVLRELQLTEVTQEACNAVFTSLAKGASNGCAWPVQVDEELSKWLIEGEGENDERVFDVDTFERSLAIGKLQVAFGWFLYVGLQFFAIYHIFLRAAVQNFAPPEWYNFLY